MLSSSFVLLPRNEQHPQRYLPKLILTMEEAIEALRDGKCIAILDSESREAETDLFFAASSTTPAALRWLRTNAGGEMYIAVASEVARSLGVPYARQVLESAALAGDLPVLSAAAKAKGGMCQGSCSVGISLDHRSTKTGASDVERSYTCRRLAGLWLENDSQPRGWEALGREFHSPGHIFLCIEDSRGLDVRKGHTELSVAVAKAAGVPPLMVGCVMLYKEGDDYGAVSATDARSWAAEHNVPFVTGRDIVEWV